MQMAHEPFALFATDERSCRLERLVRPADRALYRAKNDSRNRVRSHKIEAKPSYEPKNPKPKARLGRMAQLGVTPAA